MYSIIISALLGMAAKIMTSEFVEFVIIKCAEILVTKTSTTYDDEFLAKVKDLLNRK